jgi:molybdopterin-guanine dinucleotide biosynthesis protein A
MIGLAEGVDAVVPQVRESKAEPVHAIYAKSCLSIIREQLERSQLEINSFLNTIRVRYVNRAECQRFDPQLLSFFNINCQSDLNRALTLAEQEDAD